MLFVIADGMSFGRVFIQLHWHLQPVVLSLLYILASWSKMFGGQVVLIILNAWCLKMFLSGYGNMMASSYGFTKFFVATLCLVGFCKITFKLDSYMAALGVNLGRPSPGMGALGAAMAAQRIFSQAGRHFLERMEVETVQEDLRTWETQTPQMALPDLLDNPYESVEAEMKWISNLCFGVGILIRNIQKSMGMLLEVSRV